MKDKQVHRRAPLLKTWNINVNNLSFYISPLFLLGQIWKYIYPILQFDIGGHFDRLTWSGQGSSCRDWPAGHGLWRRLDPGDGGRRAQAHGANARHSRGDRHGGRQFTNLQWRPVIIWYKYRLGKPQVWRPGSSFPYSKSSLIVTYIPKANYSCDVKPEYKLCLWRLCMHIYIIHTHW